MSTTVNVSNIILDNDLSGTLDNPYVVSVANVRFGTLSVENGGLGLYSLTPGTILVGNGILPPLFLSGSDGDLLSWSDASGSWTSKKINNIETLSITAYENDIFSITDMSSGNDKIYNFVLNEHSQKLFLASPESTNGTASFREIMSDDLPNIISNKQFFNSTINGSFTGSANVDSIVGDGSGLFNLSSSQIIDFSDRVQHIINDNTFIFNNLEAATASINYAVISSGSFFGDVSGTLQGDGSGIENLSINAISGVYDYVNTFFSGGTGVIINSGTISIDCDVLQITSSDPNIQISKSDATKIFSLNDNLSVTSISSSVLHSSDVYSNNILANAISGNIYGNFSGLYTGPGSSINPLSIPNSALQFDYININNNRVNLGESIQVTGISNITSSNNNILTELSGGTSIINLNSVIDVPYLTADYVSSSQFVGDGSGLTNINLSNLGAISQLIPVDEENIIFNNGVLSLTQSINVQNIYSPRGYIVELDVYSISGSGAGLTNLNANNLVNTASFINSIVATIPTSPIRQFVSSTSFGIGDIVCLTSYGIQKGNNNSKVSSNLIGVVSEINGATIFVQTSGKVEVNNSIINQTSGSILYLGQNGDAVEYSSVPTNCYAVELGTLLERNKIEINFRKLWKVK